MSDERIDLDEARRQEIDAIDAKVSNTNHFEFLGVPAGASPEDVRTAFRDASRKFHPDKFFGKQLGSYRLKLDRIFKRLVEANQTLTDPARRDAYLKANPFIRAAARAAGSSADLNPVMRSELELAREEERRARLARHPYLARATKVQEALAKARELAAKGEFSQAFTHLNTASQADPRNQDLITMLAEVRKRADLAKSDTAHQHAVDALNRGDYKLALQAIRAAVQANPNNHKASFTAAELADRSGDQREATSFAQKAVDAQPENVEYRLLLARLLVESGMKAMAKRHFEEAARLEPNHPEVKKQGKKLWPF